MRLNTAENATPNTISRLGHVFLALKTACIALTLTLAKAA